MPNDIHHNPNTAPPAQTLPADNHSTEPVEAGGQTRTRVRDCPAAVDLPRVVIREYGGKVLKFVLPVATVAIRLSVFHNLNRTPNRKRLLPIISIPRFRFRLLKKALLNWSVISVCSWVNSSDHLSNAKAAYTVTRFLSPLATPAAYSPMEASMERPLSVCRVRPAP